MTARMCPDVPDAQRSGTTARIHLEVKPDSSVQATSWSAHPAKQRPRAALGAAAVILLMGAAAWLSFGWAWGIGAVVLLVASLNRFFLRSRFELDERCLVARYPLRTQRIEWCDVRRFVTDEHGGYLSTRSVPSRMDAYRGVHLLFAANREEVAERIRSHTRAAQTAAAVSTSANDVSISNLGAPPHVAVASGGGPA